ncbi:phosphoadenylyl-sulfate reductase [uncultured Thiodictyon sp.]|uniref:phosphoadenylyl-sulfate reductase n=1 Tax=uncultured Thiodictyon sp. TaxID=1846217 RepID=UPI0025D45D74|nr:phosphoadenylyl-sulfate reductase [uncultured Thiodictyon sp.]
MTEQAIRHAPWGVPVRHAAPRGLRTGAAHDTHTGDPRRRQEFLDQANAELSALDAAGRVAWARDHLPGAQVLSSSFGVQAAVMLHLVSQGIPRIPVVLIDTGYLFPETYLFIDELVARLDLDLRVYRSDISPAWLEARHGRLWENGVTGIEHYNRIHKVEPMGRALRELGVGTWFAGLRRVQSQSRKDIPVLQVKDGRYKVHPIIDWTDRDVYHYLKRYDLPYHPLWEQGYVSIGDHHSTVPLGAGMTEEETRFFGLKRECGLHEFLVST